jgi:hypothetical protein
LILDPASDRRHARCCAVCSIPGELADYLSCLLQALAAGGNCTFADPSRQRSDTAAKIVQALPQLVDGALGILGLTPGSDIAPGAGTAFAATLGHCCFPAEGMTV